MKNYRLKLEDRFKNELETKVVEAYNIAEARKIARNIEATSMINDLHRVVVTKIK